jgi:capsule biosynthesis phosphatase
MKVILLCGGAGTRFENIYPKPLNYVLGRPLIEYVLDELKCALNVLTVFYYHELDYYGFKEFLINTYKTIDFEFIKIDFRTRGPVETCYVGLKKLKLLDDEQILFLDNDNIYTGLSSFNDLPTGNFLITNKNPTNLSHYSFIRIDNENRIVEIEERVMISNDICLGGYGFKNRQTCLHYLKQVMETVEDEPFLSYAFKNMLTNNEQIKSYQLPMSYSLGTPNDILRNINKIPLKKLRIVFDLDNTILSYPTQYKDYSSVKPIQHIRNLIQLLKSKGHEIIIYTARKMVTCNDNVGKIIKAVGQTTLQSLDQLDIPYDELYFGKPYGDIYIDDKAFNTFDKNLSEQIGFFEGSVSIQDYQTNKYNKVKRINKTRIIKEGPSLEGEVWFYSHIQQSNINQYFPILISIENINRILLEFIDGTLLSKIYNEGLLQDFILIKLLNVLQDIHSTQLDDGVNIQQQDIILHYTNKFEERSRNRQNYPFENFDIIYNNIKLFLKDYLSKDISIVDVIHGDLWFSNILFLKGNFKFIDMRGKIHHKLTTKGDQLYDYAKIYQSILGLDYILEFHEHIPQHIFNKIDKLFWNSLIDRQIISKEKQTDIIKLAGYLIYNTFHAYPQDFDLGKKNLIWQLVENIFSSNNN